MPRLLSEQEKQQRRKHARHVRELQKLRRAGLSEEQAQKALKEVELHRSSRALDRALGDLTRFMDKHLRG